MFCRQSNVKTDKAKRGKNIEENCLILTLTLLKRCLFYLFVLVLQHASLADSFPWAKHIEIYLLKVGSETRTQDFFIY